MSTISPSFAKILFYHSLRGRVDLPPHFHRLDHRNQVSLCTRSPTFTSIESTRPAMSQSTAPSGNSSQVRDWPCFNGFIGFFRHGRDFDIEYIPIHLHAEFPAKALGYSMDDPPDAFSGCGRRHGPGAFGSPRRSGLPGIRILSRRSSSESSGPDFLAQFFNGFQNTLPVSNSEIPLSSAGS